MFYLQHKKIVVTDLESFHLRVPSCRHRIGARGACSHLADHRWPIALQRIEQFTIALSIYKVYGPTIQRDCPSMAFTGCSLCVEIERSRGACQPYAPHGASRCWERSRGTLHIVQRDYLDTLQELCLSFSPYRRQETRNWGKPLRHRPKCISCHPRGASKTQTT